MAPRLTKFNYKWKNIYAWIDSMPEDNHRAYCKLCKRDFSIGVRGENKVKEHQASRDHQTALEKSKSSMRRFLQSMF